MPASGSRAKGYFALFLTSTFWGTTWVASKIGIEDIPALQMASLRQGIAGLCFLIFFGIVHKLPFPNGRQFLWLTMMGLLMFVFANGLSTWSLKYIPAGMSALIGALYPISVVLIERIFYKSEKIKPLALTGFILGILGIGIVFYENAFHHEAKSFVLGISLSLIAMLSWSLGTVFISRNKVDMNPYYATGWQMLISAFILYAMAGISGPLVSFDEITLKAWSVIIYLVIFGSLVAFAAFIVSMKTLPAAIASLYAYINPLIALVSAALILNEKLTMNILWGALVTLAGIFLVNFSLRFRKKVIAENEM